MKNIEDNIDTVRASRAGHTFHERWAARRALQLVFPNDDLCAIAIEGISSTETANPGTRAEEVADLVLYYGCGDNFRTSERLETVQFKYKLREEAVTATYIKKTIEKFCDTILGYEKEFSSVEVDSKLSFIFVTNAKFKVSLWDSIESLLNGTTPLDADAASQVRNLRKWCADRGLCDANRLFSKIVFRAGEKSLAGQDNVLRRTLTDWSMGADAEARLRLYGLQDLILRKAGPSGQKKNLIRREDVLDALDCEPSDLFPADTRFIDVGTIIERSEISSVVQMVKESALPIFVHADGGVGKTVFIQSLAARVEDEFEVVVFDCFGGGSYRSENHSRHLPKIGLVQIVNELASRTLCDPMLPSGDDSRKIIRASLKRLEQAARTINIQSKKLGLLIIVDAADNAQLEADYRHEEAFPKLLLSAIGEDPIDGVRLLFTARTHRKDKVIGRSIVETVELGPFSDAEARSFLNNRVSSASGIEIATALVRSGRNARVLDYLVQTWETNVLGRTSTVPMTVVEIIAQRCTKIVLDLHLAGWADSEVTEFFVALSLLPPPIPLEELSKALGWSVAQVNTAASDLAPLLEIASHGAIFRDEPTETYIREKYSKQSDAQMAIADRLMGSQATSAYAAEALPHFLVVIQDSNRAFVLADSTSFPTTVQSEFGRRRLTLARLRAAFRLAVAEDDVDRVLGLSMRLAQVATANMRGDEFIRSSPALAIVLGDPDSYRRLFADRTGWRGARSVRLTVAHRFANDVEEAQIQCESTIRWVNWHIEQPDDQRRHESARPGVRDYTAIIFQRVVDGELATVDSNLVRWSHRFSLSVTNELMQLLELFDQANGTSTLANLISFAISSQCTSTALKLQILSKGRYLNKQYVKSLSTAIGAAKAFDHDEAQSSSIEREQKNHDEIVHAALTTLFYSSRTAAAQIIRHASPSRPTAYNFSERFGNSRAWSPVLHACVRAWCGGKSLSYHDLLPNEIALSKAAKGVSTRAGLVDFLNGLRKPLDAAKSVKGIKKRPEARFNEREVGEISGGIERTFNFIRPIEKALLSGSGFTNENFTDFIAAWDKQLSRANWRDESATDLLSRTVGLGCFHILLTYASNVPVDHARRLTGLISSDRFSIQEKIDLLGLLAQRPALYELAGEFAQHIAEKIRQDYHIEQRGGSYLKLAASLIPMSIDEAREYYHQGLAQLDQMGGENYEQIYSLLHFASVQQGGFVKPELGQRLMNLCETIMKDEPSKFGWTLFGHAAAKSIGFPALSKLVRWHDQDVAQLSYGLPQLACFLSKTGTLDPRRAAFLLTICEEHGWWDWNSGDGVTDLLELSKPADQRQIFLTVLAKVKAEYPLGAWPSLWEGLLQAADKYPNVISAREREELEKLSTKAKSQQDKPDSGIGLQPSFSIEQVQKPSQDEIDGIIADFVSDCDSSSSISIDQALEKIKTHDKLDYSSRQRFIVGLRDSCPYPKRMLFLLAICDSVELDLSQSLDLLDNCFSAWRGTSRHIVSNAKTLVKQLFESKGADLFGGRYSNVARDIRKLSDFSSDRRFVIDLVLRKIASDEVELDGDEWLQLATVLCDVASDQAGLDALELLLSGPASRIADEVGEGPYRQEHAIRHTEAEFIADVTWHLLGNEDGYARWKVARGLNTLVELGLNDEISLLLDRFDQKEIEALASMDRKLAFQNSQQWLLMGLARATLYHGQTMGTLRPKLLLLSKRKDLHIIHKVHIVRCLENMIETSENHQDLAIIKIGIDHPPNGIVTCDTYAPYAKPISDFHFDYDFAKSEISAVANLFNIAPGTVEDAVVAEITNQWPEATSLDFFSGRERYEWSKDERYEFYREHIQRHALLKAATTLSETLPVVVRSYETDAGSPWLQWRNRYDVTFEDGTWLSDRKDLVPQQAKEDLLEATIGQQEALQDLQVLLRKLGFTDAADDSALLPLYGSWSSPDRVTVRISSALTDRKGAIGRCAAFAKKPSHELWLPEFWDQGYYESRHRKKSPFAPLVWAPERHSLGIDASEEFAAQTAGHRPRLGIDITKSLHLINEPFSGDWHTADGTLALRSQVWGSWKPNPEQRRGRDHDDGEILWVSPSWIDTTLDSLNQLLVFTITLWKHRSSRDYDLSSGVKSVYVGIRSADATIRFWEAKKGSKLEF